MIVDDCIFPLHERHNDKYLCHFHTSKPHFKKWLCQTQNPPRIPVFYTLTEIHKPTPVGRPIISGVSGPTERLSAFVHKLLQPIAQQQKSYLRDTTDFINFMEGTRVPKNTVLVSMDVTSRYANIPQEEGIQKVCRAYNSFYDDQPPIPMRFLEKALGLMLQENSFQFCGKNYLQTHELPWEQKWQSMTISPIFLWAKSKQNSLTEANSNRSFGNDILTISSPSGISAERSYSGSLKKPTITTLPSNSRLKFLKLTLWFMKATDSLPNQYSMYALTTKLLRHSSTHISPRVTHQEYKEV